MRIDLDIPPGVFDDEFRAEDFATRVREFAALELLRARRLHEHEAVRMLGVERWELVAMMERAGIVPTEKQFDQIKGELGRLVAARGARTSRGEN
jgi:hypothetical protein